MFFFWLILNSNLSGSYSLHVQTQSYLVRASPLFSLLISSLGYVSAWIIVAHCLNSNRHFDCQLTNTATCWTQTISSKYRWAVGAVQMHHRLPSWRQLVFILLSKPQTMMVVSYLSHEFVTRSSPCHLHWSQKTLISLSKTIRSSQNPWFDVHRNYFKVQKTLRWAIYRHLHDIALQQAVWLTVGLTSRFWLIACYYTLKIHPHLKGRHLSAKIEAQKCVVTTSSLAQLSRRPRHSLATLQ